MAEIGELIRRYRQQAGLSQSELAGEAFSASYVSLIEAGKRQPSDDALAVFARRLGRSVDELATEPDHGVQVDLELAYARLALANGEPAAARERLQLLLGRDVSRQVTHEATVLLADACEKLGDLDSAIRVLRPLYELCLEGRSTVPVSQVAMSLSQYHHDSGDFHAAIRVGETGLQASVEGGLSHTTDHLMLHAAIVMSYLAVGDATLAAAVADELVSLAEAVDSPFGQAAGFWNAAIVAESRGRTGEALHLAQRALGLMSELGSSRNLVRLQCTVAWLILYGEPDRASEAAAILDRVSPRLGELGTPAERGYWESNRSIAHLVVGEASRAEHVARRAVLHLRDSGDDAEAAQALITLGDALVANGRRDGALASYRQAAELLVECTPKWKAASLFRSVAHRLSLAGDADGAVELLVSALDAAGVRAETASADVAFGRRPPSPAGATVTGGPAAADDDDPDGDRCVAPSSGAAGIGVPGA